jgi:hypothetical protein
MKTDMKSEMHNLGYTYLNCDVTLFCGFYPRQIFRNKPSNPCNIKAYIHQRTCVQSTMLLSSIEQLCQKIAIISRAYNKHHKFKHIDT